VETKPPPVANPEPKREDPRTAKDNKKDKKGKDKKDEKGAKDEKGGKEDDSGAKTVVINDTPKTNSKKEDPKPVVADDPPPKKAEAAAGGFFQILATPSAPIFRESTRVNSGKVDLNKQTGTIKIGDSTSPFQVTFVYRLGSDHNVDVQIDTQPWSIVKRDGISLGKTPRTWISSEGVKRYEFVSPLVQTGPMIVTMKFVPNN
jgi:hypothetical protein